LEEALVEWTVVGVGQAGTVVGLGKVQAEHLEFEQVQTVQLGLKIVQLTVEQMPAAQLKVPAVAAD
jgi:hypothetical protein